MEVYDDGAELMLSYTYDAWGNVTATVHDESTQGMLREYMAMNYVPVTYRGYTYDAYTGLYYLRSRYYNPTYGRFLNADTTEILESTQGTPLGANLFAYCNNNPVNFVDYGGMLSTAGLMFLVMIILVMSEFIIDLFNQFFDSFLGALLDYKINKVLKNYPVLAGVFEVDKGIEDILNTVDERTEIFMLYYAHAKNIVDYGTGVNNDPYYPNYNDISRSVCTYKTQCAMAYTEAVDLGFISQGTCWKNLTPEQQYVFVKGMMFYDYVMWRDITRFSTNKMGMWGTEELADFLFGFLDILDI